jgi:protoheme IX farnesyltransferase
LKDWGSDLKEEGEQGGQVGQEVRTKPTLRDYIQLTKPGIMVLLLLEALTAMIVASRSVVHLPLLGWLLLAGAFSSGGSAALNHYLERDKDLLMTRTDSRPVASGKIAPGSALKFGIILTALGLVVSYVFLNPVATLMIFLGAISYIFLYTLYLKPRTHWNIVIGGVAGVFPALAGWAAATGTVEWPAVFIGALVFLWTPPHFWGLSMKYKDDYVRSGYPMISVTKSARQVINWIVVSSVILIPFSLLPLFIPYFGSFGPVYYGAAILMGAVFIAVDIAMLKKPTADNAFRAFIISLPYLFVLFVAMILSSVIP